MFITRIIIGILISISCITSYAFNFTNKTPKLLALGDSITDGNGSISYRYQLKKLAEQSQSVHFDYIGTQTGHQRDDFSNSQHEGWIGRTSTDIILYENHSGTSQSLLEYSLSQEAPDIVLIHLGTNDLIETDSDHLDSTITEIIDTLKQGISMIRDSNPNAIILLAKIMPLYYSTSAYQRVSPFNEAIQQLGDSLNTNQSPITIVDQFSDINHSDLSDGVHPTSEGESKMAQRWFTALEPFFTKDETQPVINLKGTDTIRIIAGISYYDAGATAIDNQDGVLTVEIDDSNINTNKPGTYTVYFTATDAAGNTAQTTRTVEVYIPDTTAPIITLKGNQSLSIQVGGNYIDAGATAIDDQDGVLTVEINHSYINTHKAGTYTVYFTTTDAAGNTAQTTRIVKVYIPDTTPPVITLKGDPSLSIKIGDHYIDAGATATDNKEGVSRISIDDSAINTTKEGTYLVIFTASDKAGNIAKTTRKVKVYLPDTKPPVIKLKGKRLISIPVGSIYHDTGAIATDDTDGNDPVNIDTSLVNTKKIGTYTVIFTATDKAGNTSQATRNVKVYAPDSSIPIITLKGNSTESITVGKPYHDAGATAIDNKDGAIVVKTNSSSLDIAVVGSYIIRFTATDKAGNIATTKRIVNVVEESSNEGGGGNFSIYLLLILSLIHSAKIVRRSKK